MVPNQVLSEISSGFSEVRCEAGFKVSVKTGCLLHELLTTELLSDLCSEQDEGACPQKKIA